MNSVKAPGLGDDVADVTKPACLTARTARAATIRVLVVSDVRIYREGLAQSLGRYEWLDILGAVAVRDDALARIAELRPDAIVLDTAARESLATLRAIKRILPDTKVVAFAVSDSDDQVLACAESGAAAYVPRDASVDDLVSTLDGVVRGELVCSSRMAATLFTRLAALAAGRAPWLGAPLLTAREEEVVRLIDKGMSNKEIARRLTIETATVKNHVHNILEKLHVRRRSEAAARVRGTLAEG